MIQIEAGNILDAEVDAVINTVNTVGVMGKGLALQFKRRYPRNYDLYRIACKSGEVSLGKMFVTESPEIDGPRWIINFPTKGHWKANSRIGDIDSGLDDLIKVIGELSISSIAVPPLGAGNGGLDWADVKRLILQKLRPLEDVAIQIFEPVKAHFSIQGEAPKLTPSTALLLRLMVEYEQCQEEIWLGSQGTSHLEIQKLMYFANRAAPQIGLRYERGHFGPYSDRVRHLVKNLEGSFLSGLGDGSDRTLDLHPILVTDAGRRALQAYVDPEGNRDRLTGIVDEVLRMVDGLEGPYQLELLATVAWIADEIGSTEPAAVIEQVKSWNLRKDRLFTPRHINIALMQMNK